MEIVGGRMQTLEEVGRAWFSPKEMFRVEGSFLAFVSKEFTASSFACSRKEALKRDGGYAAANPRAKYDGKRRCGGPDGRS